MQTWFKGHSVHKLLKSTSLGSSFELFTQTTLDLVHAFPAPINAISPHSFILILVVLQIDMGRIGISTNGCSWYKRHSFSTRTVVSFSLILYHSSNRTPPFSISPSSKKLLFYRSNRHYFASVSETSLLLSPPTQSFLQAHSRMLAKYRRRQFVIVFIRQEARCTSIEGRTETKKERLCGRLSSVFSSNVDLD